MLCLFANINLAVLVCLLASMYRPVHKPKQQIGLTSCQKNFALAWRYAKSVFSFERARGASVRRYKECHLIPKTQKVTGDQSQQFFIEFQGFVLVCTSVQYG